MESTQERILQAARLLFGRLGFEGTTTAEIARSAGIAEGTIYRHFRDKKELFVACVEPVIREAIRREKAVMHGASFRELLQNRIRERIRVIRENLEVFDILFTEGKHHPEIAQLLVQNVSGSISADDWQVFSDRVGDQARLEPNPLIMNVGLTAAIWAMISVGPLAEHLFAGWPRPVRQEDLESDLADFVCSALVRD